jgi:hypothetical protein
MDIGASELMRLLGWIRKFMDEKIEGDPVLYYLEETRLNSLRP